MNRLFDLKSNDWVRLDGHAHKPVALRRVCVFSCHIASPKTKRHPDALKLKRRIHNYYWHCQLAGTVAPGGFPCQSCKWNRVGNYAGDCPHTSFRIGPIEIGGENGVTFNPVPAGKKPSKRKRERIRVRDGHKCVLCGRTENLTIDHILPRCRGGGSDEENLATLCRDCNQAKADGDNDQLQAYRQKLIEKNGKTPAQ